MTTAASPNASVADNRMPLSVKTAQGELQPLGTRFSVSQNEAYTQVAVFDGRVAAYAGAQTIVRAGIVQAGQQGSLFKDRLTDVQQVEDSAAAWVDGMLVATSTPLGEFLQTLSRHRSGYLGCDPEIASMPVSGTYPLDNTDRILSSLEQTLPVKVQTLSRYWARVVPQD